MINLTHFPLLDRDVNATEMWLRAAVPNEHPVSGDLIARHLQESDTLQEGARTRRYHIHIDIWKAGS